MVLGGGGGGGKRRKRRESQDRARRGDGWMSTAVCSARAINESRWLWQWARQADSQWLAGDASRGCCCQLLVDSARRRQRCPSRPIPSRTFLGLSQRRPAPTNTHAHTRRRPPPRLPAPPPVVARTRARTVPHTRRPLALTRLASNSVFYVALALLLRRSRVIVPNSLPQARAESKSHSHGIIPSCRHASPLQFHYYSRKHTHTSPFESAEPVAVHTSPSPCLLEDYM
ncbi:hypothetical protein BDW22DRAFT_766463 [Trametopsis cervina]|nr:hypothetical protein BDW22DRAFT_766463 [Trametopsis cervina]